MAAGLVVEEVPRGSALLAAGLEAGDVVVGWELLPHPQSPSQAESGEIRTIFDWIWLPIERASRGRIRLSVDTRGGPQTLTVEMGSWEAEVRPRLSPDLLATYLDGRERVEAGRIADGVARWEEILADSHSDGLRFWLLLKIARAWDTAADRRGTLNAYHRMLEANLPPPHRVVVLHTAGDALADHGDRRAEAALREALEVARPVRGDSLAWADAQRALAWLTWDTRRSPDTALALIDEALLVQEKLAPASYTLARSLTLKAVFLREAYEFDQAEQVARRAEKLLAEKAPESWLRGSALNILGQTYKRRGELDLGIELMEQSLELYEKLEPEGIRVSEILTNLSVALRDQGESELAEECLSWALEIQKRLNPSSPSAGVSLINLADLALRRDDPSRAEVFLQQALEIFPNSGRFTMAIYNNRSVAAKMRGDQESRIRYLELVLAVGMELNPRSLHVAEAYEALGVALLDQDETERARDHHERALAIRERLAPESFLVASSWNHLGRMARRGGDLERAARHFRRSIEALEAQLDKLGASHDVRGQHRAQFHGTYRNLIEVLLDLGRPQEAFAVLERARSQTFLAMLAERDLRPAGLPRELELERRELAESYDRTLRTRWELDPAEDAARIDALTRELRGLQQERDALLFEIRRDSPDFAALRYPEPLELGAVRESLDRGTVLLSYSVGEERTDLFIVTPEKGLRVVTLAWGELRLAEAVAAFREQILSEPQVASIRSLRRAAVEREAERLARLLIEPATAEVASAERLLLIPDGPLHLLPFGALRPTPPGEKGGRYLAQWKPFYLALSTTVFAELREDRKRPERAAAATPPIRLTAFGDPDYPPAWPPRSSQAVPGKDGTEARIADVRVRSAMKRNLFRPAPLPYTRREVEGIAALYAPQSRHVYLGPSATEERVKAGGSKAHHLHFAVHGYYDDRFPLNSALALTLPETPPEGGDNGLLQAWEIFESLRLDADLVVLSACQTGLSDARRGDGLVGLVRAFQYAGARSVAATLWSVDDRVTAELMVRFYRQLGKGLSKAEALRASQMELLHGPIEAETAAGETVRLDASAPYYWAAFQLFGDWR